MGPVVLFVLSSCFTRMSKTEIFIVLPITLLGSCLNESDDLYKKFAEYFAALLTFSKNENVCKFEQNMHVVTS